MHRTMLLSDVAKNESGLAITFAASRFYHLQFLDLVNPTSPYILHCYTTHRNNHQYIIMKS
jgi:hypothetical protein